MGWPSHFELVDNRTALEKRVSILVLEHDAHLDLPIGLRPGHRDAHPDRHRVMDRRDQADPEHIPPAPQDIQLPPDRMGGICEDSELDSNPRGIHSSSLPESRGHYAAEMATQVPEVTPAELADRLSDVVLLDVRDAHEVRAGSIEGSINIPVRDLAAGAPAKLVDRDAAIVAYCAVGARSIAAVVQLQAMGYTNVANLRGGFGRWRGEDLPWTKATSLTPDQLERYARHVVLPSIGVEGQERLLRATVAIIGAGGLGSPAALYLAAAGIGTIGIVDFDVVEASNLQRQVVHRTDRVGTSKVASAAATLRSLNPDVTVIEHDARLTADNVLSTLDGYDVVIDATDSFQTRYLVNDASLHLRTPVVHGSIFRFDGQVTVFTPYGGPCYRCLFPTPPPAEFAPNCAEAGVLGVLPGIVGSLQAVEAIKLILGIGEPLVGRLLLYDALAATTDEVRFGRDPECPACADPGHPPTIVDYDETCTPI